MPGVLLQDVLVLCVLMALMAVFYKLKKLSLAGTLAAALIGLIVYLADHWRGLFLLFIFFVLSVIATSHQKAFKFSLHPRALQADGRTAAQVFANGGVAAILALISLMDPDHSFIYLFMMACSLSSALADTLSSELGIVYGRRFYNILTFKPDLNGLDGVVSIEGTLIGALGAILVGLCFEGFSMLAVLIGVAGIIGNLSDSFLGALLERKGFIGNNFVNFLNTLIAALAGLLLYLSIVIL